MDAFNTFAIIRTTITYDQSMLLEHAVVTTSRINVDRNNGLDSSFVSSSSAGLLLLCTSQHLELSIWGNRYFTVLVSLDFDVISKGIKCRQMEETRLCWVETRSPWTCCKVEREPMRRSDLGLFTCLRIAVPKWKQTAMTQHSTAPQQQQCGVCEAARSGLSLEAVPHVFSCALHSPHNGPASLCIGRGGGRAHIVERAQGQRGHTQPSPMIGTIYAQQTLLNTILDLFHFFSFLKPLRIFLNKFPHRLKLFPFLISFPNTQKIHFKNSLSGRILHCNTIQL